MPNQIPIRAAVPPTSRVRQPYGLTRQGFGMRHAAPAAARATEPHAESACLRRLPGSAATRRNGAQDISPGRQPPFTENYRWGGGGNAIGKQHITR